MSSTEPTKVIFRLYGGIGIALFPEEPATPDTHFCQSFSLQGGHAAANPRLVIRQSMPGWHIPDTEFVALRAALVDQGYWLEEIERLPENAFKVREAKLREAGYE